MRVVDADGLARVRRLHLIARTLSARMLAGSHRSKRVGKAIEFADYQEYVPGVDPRGIDWRVWGRTDRHVVKRYEAETELPCVVVLDLSADLETGEAGRGGLPPFEGSKAGRAIVVAASLLYWLQSQREPVGLVIVAGEGIPYSFVPPRGGRKHLELLLGLLARVRPAGRGELSTALRDVGARLPRRCFVAVITDGMEEPAAWLPSLGAFVRRGADLRLLHVFDREELKLPGEEPAVYYSPEGGEELVVDPVAERAALVEEAATWMAEVRAGVVRQGGQYVALPSDLTLERVVQRIVEGRSSPVEGL